jgi:hypothetical protein
MERVIDRVNRLCYRSPLNHWKLLSLKVPWDALKDNGNWLAGGRGG